MAYQWEMISELEAKSLSSGGETVDKYISTKNCTALMIGVQCLENTNTIPTVANICTKIGTIEIVASNKDGGGPQVSYDADDIAPLMEKLYGKAMPGIYGTQTNDQYEHFQFWLPLSPDPWSSTYGFRDARLKITTSGTQTNADTFVLYVGALLHDQKPSYYVQTLMHSETGVASNGKVDEDLPEGGTLLADYAFATTNLSDLTTSDAATINDIALVVDNSEQARISNRCMHAFFPTGTYDVATTVTSTSAVGGSSYLFADYGWMKAAKDGQLHGIPIGRNWKLRLKTNAADAIRNYQMVAMPTGAL